MALTGRSGAGLAAFGLAILVTGVYAPRLDRAWLNYDDDIYITHNTDVRLGVSAEGLTRAFTSIQGANWFPLTRLSWLLDYERAGLEARAYHTTNLALHAAATLVLFLALQRLTGSPGRSAFVAAVFGIHPLHVESVAWAAARKDPLSGLCFMLALWAYAPGGAQPRSGPRMALVSACMALGLLAKQTLVSLPLVLLLLDAWPLGRLGEARARRRACLEKLPLFALAAGFGAVALFTQRSAGAVADLSQLPLGARLANALVACASYLRRAFWPDDLAIFYPHPGAELSAGAVAAAALLLALASTLAWRAARRVPAVTVGWLWYLLTLLPVLGLLQVGSQAMADRYTYLPLVGLAISVAWGLPALLPLNTAARRAGLAAAGGTALALLAVCASLQLRHWRDSEALMRRALAVTQRNHIAHTYLGVALLDRGAVAEATRHWHEALRIRPGDVVLANNLAWLLATHPDPRHRDGAAAVAVAESAALRAGDDPAVLDTLAAAYAAAGRFAEAERVANGAESLARSAGDRERADAIARRRSRYRDGSPWFD